MDINVLDKNFELLGIVDTYTSLMWCKRYNEVGALDLQIEATNETLALFKEGNYITRNDDETVYRIEAIELDTNEEKDNHLIIGAYDIKKILNQRIVYSTEIYNTTVENVIRGLIHNNFINPADSSRAINNFALKDVKGLSDKTRTQITYDNVGEKITELCKAYNYGYKVTLENGTIYFDLYQGLNRSINQSDNPVVIFSPEYDNLVSSKYNLDISEVKNVALVGGEGEGSARKKVEVGSATGIDRFEIFVDASGVSSEEGAIPASEYLEMLSENGKEELANTSVSSSFEGVVDTNQYVYKKDFDLGDIVSLENEYGIKVDARIIEIIETWDDTGYTIEPKFEYMEVPETIETVSSEAILTENGIMTLSENGIALLSETATVSNNGIKISELDETTNLENGCCFPVVQDGVNKKITFESLEKEVSENLKNRLITYTSIGDYNEKNTSQINLVAGEDNCLKIMNMLKPYEQIVDWFGNYDGYNRFGINKSYGSKINKMEITKLNDLNGCIVAHTSGGYVFTRTFESGVMTPWCYK
jgi:hypothetical protein